MKIIFFFIDGLGVAELDKDINPLYYTQSGIFNTTRKQLPGEGILKPLDATLGVKGFPQSATGQTTLYTGINAPKLISKHVSGFPNAILRNLLQRRSIFMVLKQNGLRCLFINAFRPIFFSSPELFASRGLSASSEMNRAAGLPFKTLGDIRNDAALYHDYSNQELIQKGFDLPEFDSHQAAEILIRQLENYDFILYEYFLTDVAGHSRNMEMAINELYKIEQLLLVLINRINFQNTVLLAVSDHGNIEDISVKSHTCHPAYLAVWGASGEVALKSLTDVYPFVLEMIAVSPPFNM
jgi:2,3-bisphosphoglycerate-independent phosphoglycerate mutase